MRLKKLVSGIAALAVASSAFAGLAVTASAATDADQAVDVSKFDVGGSYDSTTGIESITIGSSKQWSKLDLTPYTKRDGQVTSVTISYTETVPSGGRSSIGFYDEDLATYASNAWQDTYGAAIAYGIMGSNTNKRLYYWNDGAQTNAGGSFAVDAQEQVSITFDLENQTMSGNVGSQTFSNYSIKGINSIDTMAIYSWSAMTYQISDMKITTVVSDETYYDVTFDVDGTETSTKIISNGSVTEIPETDKPGYIFKGWAKDGDTETPLSNDEVMALAITAATKFTAVYEKDADYIEPIVSVVITGEDKMTFGPDPDTAADNNYTVTITGEAGTVITADTIDSRVTDFNVAWDIDGFATENDQPGQYCDSYGAFTVNNAGVTTTNFALRNVPMNFYGKMKATVTYNGTTTTAEKYVVALGNTTTATSQILPIGGYPSDFDSYPDSLVGYKAAHETYGNTKDIIVGEWAMSGSDPGTKAEIMAEETNKFIRITSANASKSHMYTKTIATPATQAIFTQDVRFNSTGGCITLTSKYPFWGNGYTCPVTLSFTGSGLTLNDIAVTDENDNTATVTSGAWYKIVLSVDKTNSTCFVKVYDAAGTYVGGADNVAWKEESNPTFYSIGMGNSNIGTIDFDNYSAVYPTADVSTFAVSASQDTLSIPNGDTADLSASLKTAEGYDITGAATWSVIEEDMQAGVIITPDENDSHKAKVTLAEGASAGEATVQVNIGGYTKTIVLNITSSAESVKFTKSNTSVSIPLDDNKTTAEYAAIVVDGSGADLGRSVTFAVYDKNNTAEYTLPAGITFDAEKGILTVDKTAAACSFTIRATSTNTDGESISKAVKVTVHGLSFDFGTVTDDATAEGYTAVAADTAYTAARGYGIASGTPAAGGTVSTDNADSDWLEGSFTFKANVTKGKIYTVEITYSGTLTTAYVNSDLAGYTLGTQTDIAKATYTFAVPTDVLDLTVTDGKIASITITKNADRTPNAKPAIRHIGDSTAANNGSWAYYIDHNRSSFPTLDELATFYNNGAGGRNLCTYYTQGKLAGVLNAIYPGDIVMFGNNGTNGMGSYFEEDVNYYLDAAEAMGAKIIINSYTPHGPVGNYTGGYDEKTHTFNTWRQDSYDVIVRKVAEERAASDENYLGFVEIGKNADAAFNAYVAAAEDKDAAAAEIIACFSDHNHYSEGSKARELMLNGYGDVEGTVAQLTKIVDAYVNSGEEPIPEMCTKIVATYGEGGVLSGVTFETVPVEDATATVVDGSTKTMYWDSIAGMKPIK